MRRRSAARLLALAALVSACRAGGAADRAQPEDEVWVPEAGEREGTEIVAPREEELPQALVATGRVAFDDQRVEHVFSPVAARVLRVLAAPGQRVRRGSPLVALLSQEAGSARADVLKAQADMAQASAELTRQQRLVAAQAAPRRELEAAQDSGHKAEAELARAQQRAALLRSGGVDDVTQEFTLKSAIDGAVISRAVSPGMELQGAYAGGAAAELFTVGDIDRVWVLADVAEQDVPRVRRGAEATVRVVAWPDRVFRGEVTATASALDPVSRAARVRIALANPDHALKPEMLAQVSIAVPPRRGLVLPRKALVAIQGETFAYVAEGRSDDQRLRFKRRRVRVSGEPGETRVVVESGVVAGDRVLVESATAREFASADALVPARQLEKAGIRVARVTEQEVGGELAAGSRVTFEDMGAAHVFSPVNGRIVRVLAEPGQRVKKGAPLLAMVSPDVGSAFADGVKAQADLVAAGHELERQRELVASHAGARKDLEAAQAAYQKARAELDRARQKTALLSTGSWDAVRQEYILRSPIEGEVVARAAAPGLEVQGQWSGASAPPELFTIGALDPLWVTADVYEMDLPDVRKGAAAVVRVPAYPEREFRGRVDWVSDVLDPATRTAKIRCAVANPGHLLRPEMAPVLSLTLPARRHVALPREAVLRLGDDMVVFVLSATAPDGRMVFRRRRVIVGEGGRDGTVAVLDGLAAGEQVVTSGAIFLLGML